MSNSNKIKLTGEEWMIIKCSIAIDKAHTVLQKVLDYGAVLCVLNQVWSSRRKADSRKMLTIALIIIAYQIT